MKRNERDGRQDAGRRHEGRSKAGRRKADDDSGKEKGKAASCTSKTEDEPLVRALTVTQLREAEGAPVRLRLHASAFISDNANTTKERAADARWGPHYTHWQDKT
jgi:hypothetical protein